MKYLLMILLMGSQLFADVSVKGVKVLPRQDAPTDGTIKNYEVLKSPDGVNWTSITTGTLVNDKSEKTISFAETTTRFIKFKSITEASGSKNTNIAEINLVGSSGANLDRSKWVVSADSSTTQVGMNWGPPTFAIDGFPTTFWMTKWETGGTPQPHEYIIDTGTVVSPPIPPVVDTPNESGPILVLSWDKNPENNITGYKVSYGENSLIYLTSLETTSTTITIPNLSVGKTYYFAVKAKNAQLEGPYSNEVVVKIIDKNFPSAPMPPEIVKPDRFIDIQMSIDNKVTYVSIGKIPYPLIVGQKYKTLIITEKDPAFPSTTRFINVLMILPDQSEYVSIGKVPYPTIKGQSYKSTISK